MYDPDELEVKIDKAFRDRICEPRRVEIVQFFRNILMYKEGFRLLEEEEDLEVIDIMYYASEPLGSLHAFPSWSFYDHKYQFESPHLRLAPYSYSKVKGLVKEMVLSEGVSLEVIEDDGFDTAKYWENQHELEMSFLIECWGEARFAVNTEMKAFLTPNDGSGIPIDLDTGKEISKNFSYSIETYLIRLGVNPKKMLLSEKEKKPSFFGNLFGRKRNQ